MNTRKSHNIKIVNTTFKGMSGFKYLGNTVINKNCVQEERKSKLKSGNMCCHSVQNLFVVLCATKKCTNYTMKAII